MSTNVLDRPEDQTVTPRATTRIAMPAASAPTQSELFDRIIAQLQQAPTIEYQAIANIEGMSDAMVRLIRTAGTPLEPIEQALADIGIPTDGTAGALMDSPLALDRHHVHDLACYCIEHNTGHVYDNETVGALLADVRDRKFGSPPA